LRHRPKIIFTSHGLAWDEDRNVFSKTLIYIASRLTFLLCDIVITITKDNFNRAAACLWCRRKIRLVHNGTEALPFLERDEARAALGLPPHTTVVGTIANLEWNKGLHFLVRAAGDLARDGKDFALAIIGEGEERTFLQTLIEDESLSTVVHLLGFKDKAWQYLKAFDIFALPSVKEGLPYVLIEAGQAGLPVVGSDIPGIAEVVGNQVSGLLSRPKDHHNLANKLGILIDNDELRQRLTRNLHERVEQEFSIEKMVTDTIALYR
jgi:glycosyltransferase involved in cell wall biosynthesis